MARKMRERGEEPKPTPGDHINGYLAKPGGDGPFRAILVLPDCIGLTPFVRETLTARLASWGYVALVIDSWTTRNAQAGCFLNGQEPPRRVDRSLTLMAGSFTWLGCLLYSAIGSASSGLRPAGYSSSRLPSHKPSRALSTARTSVSRVVSCTMRPVPS